MNKQRTYRIGCLGGCTVDIYPEQNIIKPGGGGLNNAVMFKRALPQGIISFVGAVGNDEHGQFLRSALAKKGILTDHLHTDSGTTSSIHIRNKKNGEKIFEKYVPGVLQTTRPTPEDITFLNTQDLLLLTVFEEIEQYSAAILQHTWNGLVVVDFRTLKDYGYKTDIVKKHIDSIAVCFFGLVGRSPELIRQVETISREHNKLCVVTLGPKGSLAFDQGKTYKQDAIHIDKIVDTTGAGDAFTAAFLAEYLQSQNIPAGLQKGALLATEVIQQHGAW